MRSAVVVMGGALLLGLGVSAPGQSGKAAAQPTFRVSDAELGERVTVIAYGDTRFHDPGDTSVANPAARRALALRIGEERPSAIQMTGDLPYTGADRADYAVFQAETSRWSAEGLRVYPVLGDHELKGGDKRGLENWWTQFPELRGRRWYSVALGSRILLLQLDAKSKLTEGSEQRAWLEGQMEGLPATVDFVMIALHHPPVADVQTRMQMDHNPQPNELSLRDYLARMQAGMHAQLVVTAGHVHNYERQALGGVMYLVSGGGGAKPYEVDRTPEDLYQDKGFPNFHYVRFELGKNEMRATMFRLKDPGAATPEWEAKDRFVLRVR